MLMLFLLSSYLVSVLLSNPVLCENVAEKRLSEYITTILNHYKQDDPIGAPIVPVPDPMDVPPITKSFGLGTMKCTNISLYGLSNFRLDYIHADLVDMQIKATIKINALNITGNYSLASFLSKSRGNFTIRLDNVTLEATSGLEVQEDGHLEAQEIFMDFFNDNITMNFAGLGYLEKGMINSSGAFIFESSKPYMIREMNEKIREDINKQVKLLPQRFPKHISPIDQLIDKAKEYVRTKYEPLKVDDLEYSTTITKVRLTHTWLHGLSNFRRVGNIVIELVNKTVVFKMDVGIDNLNGSTLWEVAIMNGRRAGYAAFSLSDLGVEISISQPLDTAKPPRLEDIHLSLGEVHIGFNGAGIYDAPIVILSNILPNFLNQQILGCLELLIKFNIRQVLTEVSLDEIIIGNLHKLDELKNSSHLFNLVK